MIEHQIRIGVIGAGAIASSVHLPIMKRRADLFEIVALSDVNIDAVKHLADRFGIPNRYKSAKEMIDAGGLDAVAILNSGSHAEFVVTALNSGLHVFCEKPLAYSELEMKQIESALKSSGRNLMIGYMKTFDPAVIAAAEKIKDRPRMVDVLVLHPSPQSQLATTDLSVNVPPASIKLLSDLKISKREMQADAIGIDATKAFGDFYTDVILGSIIHELSVLRSLNLHISEIDFVDRWPVSEKCESIIIFARTDDGVRITIRWFYLENYPAYQEEIRWVNENEGHHIIFASPYILRVPTQYIHTKRYGLDREESMRLSYVPSFENELVAFHKLTQTGHQPVDPIEVGRQDLVISQKIAQKIAAKEEVKLGGELA